MVPDHAAPPGILVVDDDASFLKLAATVLQTADFADIQTSGDGREAMRLLEQGTYGILLLDMNMPNVHGEEVLSKVSAEHPEVSVIVLTGESDVELAVKCMKLGAFDYILKPFQNAQLVTAVRRAMAENALRFEASRLREHFFSTDLDDAESFSEIITSDATMIRLFGYLEAISRGNQPVLVLGETGTGKELVARALHRASSREGPFVAVNVAGLDDTMFSDTLFGHHAGAFTGAARSRTGMIEKAGTGTLFLDEIGDLSEASQVKLLRLLQENEYYPLGSDTPQRINARVVAATHKDPKSLRSDLYYRLRSYQVRIPPLRERLGDLPEIVDHFLEQAAGDLGKSKPTVPGELFVYLSNYSFPGNVRELRSMVFDAVARHGKGVMTLDSFLEAIEVDGRKENETGLSDEVENGSTAFPFPMPTLRFLEEEAVDEAMRRVKGNRSAAARMLGVSRPTISRSLERSNKPPSED